MKALMGWKCSWGEENKEYILNIGGDPFGEARLRKD
jgi:hypothetical protein